MNPFQIVVNLTAIAILGFTHFQAFKLGRASMDNIFTRWLGNPTEKVERDKPDGMASQRCTAPQSEADKPWYEHLLD